MILKKTKNLMIANFAVLLTELLKSTKPCSFDLEAFDFCFQRLPIIHELAIRASLLSVRIRISLPPTPVIVAGKKTPHTNLACHAQSRSWLSA
jgi:hypothetical protein